jgi:hypothetical protein
VGRAYSHEVKKSIYSRKEVVSKNGHNLFFSILYNSHVMNSKWRGKRIIGCESKNHTSCKGELWECERCHKKVCWEEGSTDLLELCDDCWYDVRVLGQKYLTPLDEWMKMYPNPIGTQG